MKCALLHSPRRRISVSRAIVLSGMLRTLLKGMVNMNAMHLGDEFSVYTFQTLQKKTNVA